HQPEKGCARARDMGLRHATGDLVAFLDADDLMLPERLEKDAELMAMYPQAGLVLGDYQNFTDGGMESPYTHLTSCDGWLRLIHPTFWPHHAIVREPLTLLAREAYGIASTITVRRSTALAWGGYQNVSIYDGSEDFYFIYTIARHNPIIVSTHLSMRR